MAADKPYRQRELLVSHPMTILLLLGLKRRARSCSMLHRNIAESLFR
jgi:hypothetical protein